MSSWSTMRAVITALMPKGAIWKAASLVTDVRDLDLLLNGIADNQEAVRSYLATLAHMRDPFLTTLLDDLERELGIAVNETLHEEDRRKALAAKKYAFAGTGGVDGLQKKLDEAGFDLVVQQNNPAIDPDLFLSNAYQCIANNTTAVAGNDAAFAGFSGGELIVNGDQYMQEIGYEAQANGANTVAGNNEAVAGFFFSMTRTLITYETTDDTARWNYVFYVGGPVTTWSSSPVFERGQVRSELETLLRTIIMQHKPMHSWCGLVVDYI